MGFKLSRSASVDRQWIPSRRLVRAAAWKNQARGHATFVPLPSGDTSRCFDVGFLPDERTVVLFSLHSAVIDSFCSVKVRTVNSSSGPLWGEGLGSTGWRLFDPLCYQAVAPVLEISRPAYCYRNLSRCWPFLCSFPKPFAVAIQQLWPQLGPHKMSGQIDNTTVRWISVCK